MFWWQRRRCVDVIAPSLPGFGFSGRPQRPIGPRKMSDILNNLMTQKLGYKNYLAQGGDWGGAITTWLAYDHSKTCNAIHINILPCVILMGHKLKKKKIGKLNLKKIN
jgi:microsomal epoxide hydrolase